MRLHIEGAPALTVPASVVDATDAEMEATALRLITLYKPLLSLADWHVALVFDPKLNVVGHTVYSTDKREAILSLRTEMMRRDKGRLMAYTVAHELSHLVLADLGQIRLRITMGMADKMVKLVEENWKWVDEATAHKIALLLPGVQKPEPEFWWEPFNDGNPE